MHEFFPLCSVAIVSFVLLWQFWLYVLALYLLRRRIFYVPEAVAASKNKYDKKEKEQRKKDKKK